MVLCADFQQNTAKSRFAGDCIIKIQIYIEL